MCLPLGYSSFSQYPALYLSVSRLADEDLGQTGLSDTAEMLDELVREGYLSPSDLDWSHSKYALHSRYGTYNSVVSKCLP